MVAGLTAGSIAAVVAVLVSLPLRSPDDILLNSATVTISSLLAGVIAGVVWRLVGNTPNRPRRFGLIWTAIFAVVALITLGGETQLERFITFVLPLAAIVFALTGLLIIVVEGIPLRRRRWSAVAAVLLALALGTGLAGQGDEKSGDLQLPPPASFNWTLPPAIGAGEFILASDRWT
tara:strand:- start:110 stop:640 length:531 start_codon:yes stop_codon:yes gene_type:complete